MIVHSFPKIMAVGSRPVSSIFEDSVEITEKLDGSQFAFGMLGSKLDSVLCMRSKGAIIYTDAVQSLFAPVVAYVTAIQKKLPLNIVFYGETLHKPKHNTLAYDRVPKHNFALFGIHYLDEDRWGTSEDMQEFANILDFDVVPVLYKGYVKYTFDKTKFVQEFLEKESYLGGQKIEGVVIKNYHKQTNIANDIYTPFMSAKYVSEHFKEVHQNRWGSEEKPKGKWESFCNQYLSEARWDKAVIHLKERGLLKESPSDIGMLLKEVNQDITLEEKETIKEFLWSIHKKELLGIATRGLAEWYKQKLVKDTYELN